MDGQRIRGTCATCGGATRRSSATLCRPCRFAARRVAAAAAFANRFWAKVDQSPGPDGCWPWLGGSWSESGYGLFAIARAKNKPASRLALELTLGRDLEHGEMALHTCDKPPCCNPAHLFVGSNADNMADAARKGRLDQRLNASQVRELRSRADRGERVGDLASAFAVHLETARRIAKRQTRRHVTEVAA